MDGTTTKQPRPHKLFVVLNDNDYQALTAAAERDTRSPDQQAAHLLRRALRRRGRRAVDGIPPAA